MREMVDRRVGTREEEALVSVVGPPDEVRRAAVVSVDLDDLRVAIGFTHVVTLDDQPVADVRLHDALLVFGVQSRMRRRHARR
jgi:hypothetical protein